MRERIYKFRAWENNKMMFGGIKWLLKQLSEAGKTFEEGNLMQFTGLKDKKGKNIYEEDIVEYQSYYEGDHKMKGGKAKVEFVEGGFALMGLDGQFVGDLWEMINNDKAGIVIGNKYENPELLEAKND